MTDQSHRFPPAASASLSPAEAPPAARHGVRRGVATATTPPRLLLAATVALAVAATWLATGGPEAARAAAADPELTWLLRSMAVTKLSIVFGALALAAWRLGRPAGAAALAGWVASVGLLAAGSVLIWRIAPVGLGALAFHAGLLLLLLTAALDRGAVGAALAEMIAARRRNRGAGGG